MNSEEKDDVYWLGVRDALRMVDSFLKWSKRNPEKAKSLDEFIHEGLIAAAQRCEECLSSNLGLKFGEDRGEDQTEVTEPIAEDVLPPDDLEDIPPLAAQDETVAPDELPLEPVPEPEMPSEPTMHFELDEAVESLSMDDTSEVLTPDSFIDSDEPEAVSATSDLDELTSEEPTADIGSEFALEEPESLIIDSEEPTPSEDFDLPEEHPVEPTTEDASGITWKEYEEMLSPEEETDTVPVMEESDALVEDLSTDDDVLVPPPAEVVPDRPVEPSRSDSDVPAAWSPYDEPELPLEEFAEDEEEELEDDLVEDEAAVEDSMQPEAPESEEIVTPPPPPAPDESDDERKRRARRLFFGSDS